MTFHNFFKDLFKFSVTLGLAVTFGNFQNLPSFRVFFDLTQLKRNELWRPAKCVLLALFNNSSLSHIVLALTSAATNLQNITNIFPDFPGPTSKFHDFPGLGN